MPAIGKPLHLRLFLEGVEVPVISASVSIGINSCAAASIQIIPHDTGLRLKPRTMVHLFYLDNRVTDTVAGNEITRRVERSLRDYKLLFSGEFIAYSFQQTPQSRGLVLQCVDFSSYWDTAHATALEYALGGNALTNTGAVYGSNVSTFDDIVSHQAEKLVQWLNEKPLTPGLQTVSGLAGGIIRILEAIGGVPSVQLGVNDFFTIAELRCKVLAQIVAEENDDTAYRLLKVKVFDEWIRTGLQNMGQQVTFRDILKLLFNYIYYEVVPNPVARFTESTAGSTSTVTTTYDSLLKTPEGAKAKGILEEGVNGIRHLAEEDAANLSSWPNVIGAAKNRLQEITTALTSLSKRSQKSSEGVSAVLAKVSEASGVLDSLRQTVFPTSWAPFIDYADALQRILTVLGVAKGGYQSVSTTRSTGRTQQLHSQIIRPDCWFAPAPVCNVVFPDQYASLQYDRNFMGEVSRVLAQMYNTLVGPDRLLATMILIPNFTKTSKKMSGRVGTNSYRLLMDHERHTGIVPREEWIPNTSSGGSSTAKEKSKEDLSQLRLTWGERIALFHFFKYRFAQRGAQVSGRFNPKLVCGFPGVIIRAPFLPTDEGKPVRSSDVSDDATKAADWILKNAKQLGAPTHLIGMIGSVSHSVSQDGGMTSFTLHHARHHNGDDDEFLHLAKKTKVILQTRRATFNYKQIQARKEGTDKKRDLEFLIGCTPQGNVSETPAGQENLFFTIDENATPEVAEKAKSAIKTPPYTAWGQVDGKKVHIPSPAGRVTRGEASPTGHGSVAAVIVTDATLVQGVGPRIYSEVVVVLNEEIPIDGDVPTEEVLRPRAWFSEKYSNDQIGPKIYQPFFGCDSIIDEMKAQLGDTSTQGPAVAEEEDVAVSAEGLAASVHIAQVNANANLKHSIERSVDFLAYAYGQVKLSGGSVDDFINQYTHRPVATREDMLGSDDLDFDVAPNGKAKLKAGNKGRIGFHTMAIHPTIIAASATVKLAGLTEDSTLPLPRVTTPNATEQPLGDYDVRKEKWDQVMAYYSALTGRRAFRG